MKKLILMCAFFLSHVALAHEGAHGPEQKMAPHGGILKDGKALMGELVQDAAGIKIYLLSHDSKAIATKDVQIDMKLLKLTDAKKKAVKVEVINEVDAILLKFDKSSSYRYNLNLPVSFGKLKDTLIWQFEPQGN